MDQKPLFVRKKEDYLDEPGYRMFKEDWDFLSKTIVELAQRLYNQGTSQFICYKSSKGTIVNFCDLRSLKEYFDKCLLVKKQLWLSDLKDNGGEIWETFDQYLSAHDQVDKDRIEKIFELSAWNSCKGIIFEWAILVSLIFELRKYIQNTSQTISLGPDEEPTLIDIKGHQRYIWYQKSLIADFSGMKAVPDILITKDSELPTMSNITGIIECKNVNSIGTKIVREEYGKSYDIGPDYIILCSYSGLSHNIKEGVRRFGMKVLENPISTNKRDAVLSKKVLFHEGIVEEILRADEEKLFRKLELSKREQVDQKRILIDR